MRVYKHTFCVLGKKNQEPPDDSRYACSGRIFHPPFLRICMSVGFLMMLCLQKEKRSGLSIGYTPV